MRVQAGACAVIVCGLVFGMQRLGQTQPAQPVTSDKLVPQLVAIAEGVAANFVKAPLDKFNVRVLTPLVATLDGPANVQNVERSFRGFFLEDYRRRYNAAAVLAGGYASTFSPPTPFGLVKSNGVIISPASDAWLTEAMFCSDVNKVSIQRVGHPADRPDYRDCLQAGPLLLVDASPPKNVPSVSAPEYPEFVRLVQEQAFVCLDAGGQVVLGVTDKIDLMKLVGILRRSEIGCVNAMGLTGQETAGLRVSAPRKLFGHDAYLYPSALGVFPRGP